MQSVSLPLWRHAPPAGIMRRSRRRDAHWTATFTGAARRGGDAGRRRAWAAGVSPRGRRWGRRGPALATPGQRQIILALGNGFHILRSCEFGMAAG